MKGLVNKSDEFRKLLIQQAEKYNIPFLHLCNHVNIEYKKFLKGYANIKELRNSEVQIPDYKLAEMARLVGIDVRMTLVIKDETTFEAQAQEIKQKLKDEYRDSKEKNIAAKAE